MDGPNVNGVEQQGPAVSATSKVAPGTPGYPIVGAGADTASSAVPSTLFFLDNRSELAPDDSASNVGFRERRRHHRKHGRPSSDSKDREKERDREKTKKKRPIISTAAGESNAKVGFTGLFGGGRPSAGRKASATSAANAAPDVLREEDEDDGGGTPVAAVPGGS